MKRFESLLRVQVPISDVQGLPSLEIIACLESPASHDWTAIDLHCGQVAHSVARRCQPSSIHELEAEEGKRCVTRLTERGGAVEAEHVTGSALGQTRGERANLLALVIRVRPLLRQSKCSQII